MLEAPIPADEEERLALLKACHIIYTPAEEARRERYTSMTELAGALRSAIGA